ncbi:tetraspanin-18-like [Pomacea canaliculata]|uniref:tetraspanin-18-like n=1 Tax=Pomacea canaliculata TaxID=400727 RepID=UPI000D7310E1|nr:tetraspanin-18-like [Pomacea canaliculata]
MLQTAAIIIITSGFLVFGLGVVGCCGACKQTKCLLALYVGAVALALVLTLAATSVALAYRTVVAEELLAKLRDSLITRYQGYITSDDQFSRAMDFAQVEFQCCGVNSWQDYNLTTNWTVRSSAVVPLTCCILDRDAYRKENFYVLQDMACARSPNSTNSNIDTPCYGKIKEWIETQAYVIGGLGIAICVLQLAGMLLALCLMTSWKSKDSDYFYRDSYLRS